MNIALFATPGMWAPMQGLLRWIATGAASASRRQSAAKNKSHLFALESKANQISPVNLGFPHLARQVQRRPLRIVRVMEAGQAPSHVGRMVISGRMADVCAELDRLASYEAARH